MNVHPVSDQPEFNIPSKVWSEKPSYHHVKSCQSFTKERNVGEKVFWRPPTFQEDGNVRYAEKALTQSPTAKDF